MPSWLQIPLKRRHPRRRSTDARILHTAKYWTSGWAALLGATLPSDAVVFHVKRCPDGSMSCQCSDERCNCVLRASLTTAAAVPPLLVVLSLRCRTRHLHRAEVVQHARIRPAFGDRECLIPTCCGYPSWGWAVPASIVVSRYLYAVSRETCVALGFGIRSPACRHTSFHVKQAEGSPKARYHLPAEVVLQHPNNRRLQDLCKPQHLPCSKSMTTAVCRPLPSGDDYAGLPLGTARDLTRRMW